MLTREVLPEAALRVFDALLRVLRDAGFDRELAAQGMRTIVAYAMGYATMEVCCRLCQPDFVARRGVLGDVPPDLAEAASAVAECDPDLHFDFGLETILGGLAAMRRVRRHGRSER